MRRSGPSGPMTVAGVDRSGGRWVVAYLEEGGVRVEVAESAGQVVADVVGIDIPLGFPEPGSRRQAEIEGRRLLGTRASTLFLTPPREAFDLPWGEARLLGVSKQAWNLGPAIRDALAAADHGWYEVHPELVFLDLHAAPLPPKRTGPGSELRQRLLADVDIRVGSVPGVPLDDVLDAAACALGAFRIGTGEANSVGGDDGGGSIWF